MKHTLLIYILFFSVIESISQIDHIGDSTVISRNTTFSKPKHIHRIQKYWSARKGFDTINVNSIIKSYKKDFLKKSNQIGKLDAHEWTSYGPMFFEDSIVTTLGHGRVNTMLVDPIDPNIWYILSGSGGLWITRDGGGSWEEKILGDGLVIGQTSIAVNPSDKSHIVVVSGDSDGLSLTGGFTENIYQTFNQGLDWEVAIDSFTVQQNIIVSDIEFSQDGDTLLLAGNKGMSLYVRNSDNNRYNFLKDIEYSGNSVNDFKQLVYVPENNSYYASSIGYLGPAALLKSEGGVDNFQVIDELPEVRRLEMSWSPADPNNLYTLASSVKDENFEFLRKYEVFTDEHTNINVSIGDSILQSQTGYNLSLSVSHQDKNNIYIAGVLAAGSKDGGQTWDTIAKNVHVDHHDMYYDEASGRIFSCNDGGVFSSIDGSDEWTNHSNGLNITQFYRLNQSKKHPEYILGSSQDNGTIRHFNGTSKHIVGRDGMDAIISDSIPNNIAILTQTGVLGYSTSSGESVRLFRPQNKVYYPFLGTIAYTGNEDSFYYGAADLLEFSFGDSLGVQLTDFGNIRMINAFCVDPHDSDHIAVAKHDTLYITNDKFETYKQYVLPQTEVLDMGFVSTTSDSLLISFGLYNQSNRLTLFSNGVFNDGIGNGLPRLPINAIARIGDLYPIAVASDMGVHYKESPEEEWELINGNLPTSLCSDIEYDDKSGYLSISTFGRGIWRLRLKKPTLELISWKNDSTSICWDSIYSLSLEEDILEDIEWNDYDIYWNDGDSEGSKSINNSQSLWVTGYDEINDRYLYSDFRNIYITPEPDFYAGVANDKNDDRILCEGDSLIVFIYSPEKPGWEESTYWNNGIVNTFISVKEAGEYWAYSTGGNGCIGYTDTISISVLSPDNISIYRNQDILIAPDNAESYSWFINDELQSETGQSIILSIDGVYHAEFLTEDGCTFKTESYEHINPVFNPSFYYSKENQSLSYWGLYEQEEFEIYDIYGQRIVSESIAESEGIISLCCLSIGHYFILVSDSTNNRSTYNLLIQ